MKSKGGMARAMARMNTGGPSATVGEENKKYSVFNTEILIF